MAKKVVGTQTKVKKLPSKRKEVVYAFIDSQNLNIGTKASGWSLDFGKFRLFLRNKYYVKRAFLFIGYIEGNAALYRRLQEYGYILVFKNVLEVKKGGISIFKGNVDAELVLHAMIEFPNYQKAVIVSGDGDFYCLVEYLERQGKLLKLIAPNTRYSSLLRKYGSYIFQLGAERGKLKMHEKERHSRGIQG